MDQWFRYLSQYLPKVACMVGAAFLVLGSPSDSKGDWWPEGWYDQATQGAPGNYPDIEEMEVPFFWDTAEPARILSIALIRTYQTGFSKFRTGNCPFHPSCSRYGLRAISDYGALWGWLMTIDRMFFRENQDMYHHYPRVEVGLESRPYDPPRFDFLFQEIEKPLVPSTGAVEW